MTDRNEQLNDCIENLSSFHAALYTLMCLVAGCDDADMPSPRYLWQLLQLLSRDCEDILLGLQCIENN